LNKNLDIETFLDKWLEFREEDLSILSFDDKKHIIYFDEHSEEIIKNVADINKKFVKKHLCELDNEFADYTAYWNRKYYKNGFKDALKLFLFSIID